MHLQRIAHVVHPVTYLQLYHCCSNLLVVVVVAAKSLAVSVRHHAILIHRQSARAVGVVLFKPGASTKQGKQAKQNAHTQATVASTQPM